MLAQTPYDSLTRDIIGSAIEVHRALGPGLLESAYVPCLQYELSARGLRWRAQQVIPIIYKGMTFDASYRVDLVVEGSVLVELKAVETLLPVHDAQVLTYLRLTGCPVGLLITFNVAKLIDGVRRLLNTHTGDRASRGHG